MKKRKSKTLFLLLFFLIKIIRKSAQSPDTMVNFHVAICNLFLSLNYWTFSHLQFALLFNVWLATAEISESLCVSARFFWYLQEHVSLTTAWVNNCLNAQEQLYNRVFAKCWFWNPSPESDPGPDSHKAKDPEWFT